MAILKIAEAVAQIPQPRIGYFGAIEPWLIDQELIKRASRERPELELDLHRQQVARPGD